MTKSPNIPLRNERSPMGCPGCDFLPGEPSRSCKCYCNSKRVVQRRSRRQAKLQIMKAPEGR